MQLSHLALVPLLALGGYAAGQLGTSTSAETIDYRSVVSRDGFAVLNVAAGRHTIYEVPKKAYFVLTDIEVLPVQGVTPQIAVYEHPFDKMPYPRLSGDFLAGARIYDQLKPRSDLVFQPGSKIVLGPNREFTGPGCFCYHVRGRLIWQ